MSNSGGNVGGALEKQHLFESMNSGVFDKEKNSIKK